MKAKKPRTQYKNTNTWLNAVYKENKQYIDSKIETTGNTSKLKVFKALVNEYISEGNTPNRALRKLEASTVFTETKDRLTQNMYKALKADKFAYKEFRELTKIKGKYQKIDFEKFQYNSEDHTYRYGNVIISFENSPYQVVVRGI